MMTAKLIKYALLKQTKMKCLDELISYDYSSDCGPYKIDGQNATHILYQLPPEQETNIIYTSELKYLAQRLNETDFKVLVAQRSSEELISDGLKDFVEVFRLYLPERNSVLWYVYVKTQ